MPSRQQVPLDPDRRDLRFAHPNANSVLVVAARIDGVVAAVGSRMRLRCVVRGLPVQVASAQAVAKRRAARSRERPDRRIRTATRVPLEAQREAGGRLDIGRSE